MFSSAMDASGSLLGMYERAGAEILEERFCSTRLSLFLDRYALELAKFIALCKNLYLFL